MNNRPLHTPVHRETTREQILGSVETVLSPMDEFVANRILASARWKQKTMLFTNFGRWLEEDEKRIVNQAKEGLESVEDRLAAACYAVDKIKSRKTWKLEQKRNEAASHFGERVKAAKVVIDGKTKWDDAQVHELPPVSHGKAHESAYYAIKLPDGTMVNLGKSVDGFAAKLNKYPSQALQNIAARLGIEMRGGDTAILNHLLGAEQVVNVNDKGETESNYKWLPSYTSVWQGVWIVYVGWRLNPKVSDSSYWLNDSNELTQFNPNYQMTPEDEGYQAPLTLSQLDYHLLAESSDLAVENEDGETVEFMNEEEEFLTFAPQRESGETFINFSKYCDDDAEMELFGACSAVIERSEGGVTLGDLESSQFIDGYINQGIFRTERSLRQMRAVQDPDEDLLATIAGMEDHLARLNRLDGLWNDFVGIHYDEPMPKQATFGAKGDFREPLKCQPFMSLMPHNTIEAPLAREVDVMPDMTATSHAWKGGHPVGTTPSKLLSWHFGLSPKVVDKRMREARKGQVLRAIEEGTLKVQLAFSSAFEEALRAG